MKSPIDRLRKMSALRKKQNDKAESAIRNIKIQADAAKKVSEEIRAAKG